MTRFDTIEGTWSASLCLFGLVPVVGGMDHAWRVADHWWMAPALFVAFVGIHIPLFMTLAPIALPKWNRWAALLVYVGGLQFLFEFLPEDTVA